jgi:hypothetical protein
MLISRRIVCRGATAHIHPGQSARHFPGASACDCLLVLQVGRKSWCQGTSSVNSGWEISSAHTCYLHNCLWVSMFSLPKSPSHFPAALASLSFSFLYPARRCFCQWKCARTKPTNRIFCPHWGGGVAWPGSGCDIIALNRSQDKAKEDDVKTASELHI